MYNLNFFNRAALLALLPDWHDAIMCITSAYQFKKVGRQQNKDDRSYWNLSPPWAHPKLRNYTMPWKLACCLPQNAKVATKSWILYQVASPSILDILKSPPIIFKESSPQLWFITYYLSTEFELKQMFLAQMLILNWLYGKQEQRCSISFLNESTFILYMFALFLWHAHQASVLVVHFILSLQTKFASNKGV